MTASELFRAGRLKEAIAAALDQVRNSPTETGPRLFLSELLCFSGELERADNHLDAIGQSDPQIIPWIATFRQLIRAEQAVATCSPKDACPSSSAIPRDQ